MKQPFFLRFKNETVTIPKSYLVNESNVIVFSQKNVEKFLETERPELLPAYQNHCIEFENKFKMIDQLLKTP